MLTLRHGVAVEVGDGVHSFVGAGGSFKPVFPPVVWVDAGCEVEQGVAFADMAGFDPANDLPLREPPSEVLRRIGGWPAAACEL